MVRRGKFMGKSLRIYKDEYDSLPKEYKVVQRVSDDGQIIFEDGLTLGRKSYPISDLVIVEKRDDLKRGNAKHIAICSKCGNYEIIYANGICAACYMKENFMKNHPEEATARIKNVEMRKKKLEERKLKSKRAELDSRYPNKILIDAFGEIAQEFDENSLNALNTVINNLKDSYREVAELYYKQDKTMQEIADMIGCSRAWIGIMVDKIRLIVRANKGAILSGRVAELVYPKLISQENIVSKENLVSFGEIRKRADKQEQP